MSATSRTHAGAADAALVSFELNGRTVSARSDETMMIT